MDMVTITLVLKAAVNIKDFILQLTLTCLQDRRPTTSQVDAASGVGISPEKFTGSAPGNQRRKEAAAAQGFIGRLWLH